MYVPLVSGPSTWCHDSSLEAKFRAFTQKTLSKLDIESRTTNANSKFSTVSMKKDSWESHCFDKLGNEILDQVVSEVDPNDPIAIRLLGSDTKEKRDERMKKLTENMKATTTHYGYGDYPWNPVSRFSEISACHVGTAIRISSNF